MKTRSFGWCLFALILSAVALASAGCQTSKGLGKDVENLGTNIQDAAK